MRGITDTISDRTEAEAIDMTRMIGARTEDKTEKSIDRKETANMETKKETVQVYFYVK